MKRARERRAKSGIWRTMTMTIFDDYNGRTQHTYALSICWNIPTPNEQEDTWLTYTQCGLLHTTVCPLICLETATTTLATRDDHYITLPRAARRIPRHRHQITYTRRCCCWVFSTILFCSNSPYTHGTKRERQIASCVQPRPDRHTTTALSFPSQKTARVFLVTLLHCCAFESWIAERSIGSRIAAN